MISKEEIKMSKPKLYLPLLASAAMNISNVYASSAAAVAAGDALLADAIRTASSSASSTSTDASTPSKIEEIGYRMNKNWSYPSNATLPVEATDSWKLLTVDTARGTTSMVAWDFEKQHSFTEALDEITNSKLIMECSNIARIMRMSLVHSVLGDKAMLDLARRLQKKHKGSLFNVMSDLSWEFFKKSAACASDGKFYAAPFVNLPEYGQFKDGADGNHNIIRLPNGLYIGFAPDFFTKIRTNDEVVRYLFDTFTSQTNLIKGKETEHAKFCTGLTLKKFRQLREEHQAENGYYVFNPPVK
jgi:hypothetical protein